jgi:hypothetical protein
MRVKSKIVFVLLVAALQLILYFSLSINGYMRIYDLALERSVYFFGESDKTDDEYLTKLWGEDCRNDVLFLNRRLDGNAIDYDGLRMNAVYLNKYYKLQYIVLDCGYADGQLMNLYLGRRDVERCREIAVNFDCEQLRCEEFMKFLEFVAGYNEEAAEPLLLLGVAPQTNAETAAAYASMIIRSVTDRYPSADISSSLSRGRKDAHEYLENLKKSTEKYPNQFKHLLVESYFEFTHTVNSYTGAAEPTDQSSRDIIAADNFAALLSRHIRAKYLIQYSRPTFTAGIYSQRPDMKNRSAGYTVRYKNGYGTRSGAPITFSMPDEVKLNSEGEQAIIYWDDGLMRCFESYRRFVYNVNQLPSGRYLSSDDGSTGGAFMILADSAPLTELQPPEPKDDGEK